MQNKKLHIIFSLVAVFLFPIVYQPLHILEHQPTTSVKVQCELSHGHANHKPNSEIQPKQDVCLVCNYELTTQSVARIIKYTPPITTLIAHITDIECSSASISVMRKNITRPPPAV